MYATHTIPTHGSRQRPLVLVAAHLLVLSLRSNTLVQAAPLASPFGWADLFDVPEGGKKAHDASLWIYLGVAAALVLLGGAFAGLTIALMGQDEIYLQVIRDSGDGAERKHAEKVLRLLRRGKHWVLVTLLLSNVITNETLPIVLDRSLGGGWPAVLGSTVLIVIFGEIAPQSVCVRYGLPIGAWMSPFVLSLMYLLAPVAWPTAKLLDYLLGKDHGTVYKKAGLKTLVSLHKSLGEASQQLNADEVTIISAVLDLKDKSIGRIMTPMDDVFTLSLDDVLDEETMEVILSQGYSRIPIHHPDNDENFVGMLLVKMLITYDPEDAKPVRDFALATLPETRPDTSCLDIVNFFQEGKSHMVLVSEYPGDDHGALGVVTLEDVIEELIGEEIVDESDVFIDVHKAIRRAMPAPRLRIPKGQFVAELPSAQGAGADLIDIGEGHALTTEDIARQKKTENNTLQNVVAPTHHRRKSSTNSFTDLKGQRMSISDDVREHLSHLGPSNRASRPRTTRYNTVKIKPGADTTITATNSAIATGRMTPHRRISEPRNEYHGGIGEGLLTSGGKPASDGVQALQTGYGSMGYSTSPNDRRPPSVNKSIQANLSPKYGSPENGNLLDVGYRSPKPMRPRSDTDSTVGSLPDARARSRSPYYHSKGPARSGSITENIIDSNGFRKVVLETTSSSDSNGEEDNSGANKKDPHNEKTSRPVSRGSSHLRGGGSEFDKNHDDNSLPKKRRRRKRKQGGSNRPSTDSEPLLCD